MDLVIRCQSLPMPGETIMAESSMEVCGGKGANQAVAAARAGGQVTMIGRVGDDAFGGRLISNLEQAGVDTRLVERTRDCASGLAIVAVERSSQNSIMVVAGANGRVCPDDVEAARGVIEASDILLLQLEVPTDAVIGAIEIARKAGVRIVLDPAPSLNSWPPDLLDVDLLCPNRSEAARMLGVPDESIETREDAEKAARALSDRGARNVVITLGDQGAVLFDGKHAKLAAPHAIDAVDSTAAGDAFAGALAVHWAEQDNLVSAVEFANAAGAIAVSREGAQPGMAERSKIEELWRTTQ